MCAIVKSDIYDDNSNVLNSLDLSLKYILLLNSPHRFHVKIYMLNSVHMHILFYLRN